MNKLGKTDLLVSPLGFGGIVVMDSQAQQASDVVRDAVEAGVNYFDVAPSYGNAQEVLGGAIEPFRKDIVLSCKTLARDADGAKKELDRSLKELKTDHFDLYQLHGLIEVEKDVKAAFSKSGAMKTVLEAKRAGLIRYIGFSTHSSEAALAAMNEYDFDTVMCPVNYTIHHKSGLDIEILKEAKKRQMGIIALKALARRKLATGESRGNYQKCWYEPIDEPEIAKLALSWTLSQGADVAVSPGEESLFRMALKFYKDCGKLSDQELDRLKSHLSNDEAIF